MSRIVFLLEERSMKELLLTLLPRLFPALPFQYVVHEGKHDLERSVVRKLRAWREPGVRFIVVRDNDGGDCAATKRRLAGLCAEAGRPDTVVRIACQELEAWYLGDPDALAIAFGDERLRRLGGRERFRDPDAVIHPSRALSELAPAFQKISGARTIGGLLDPQRNRSRSFRVFLDSVGAAARALLADESGAR